MSKEVKKEEFTVQITEEERDNIESIYEKINSLTSLSRTLCEENGIYNENSNFYDRIINDLNHFKGDYSNWWKKISKKYHLEMENLDKYYVNFSDCRIHLIL